MECVASVAVTNCLHDRFRRLMSSFRSHELQSGLILKALIALGLFIVLLHSLSAALFHAGYEQVRIIVLLFDLRLEGNVPQFFSASLFLLIAALLYAGHIKERCVSGGQGLEWLGLSLLAVFLAVDEAAQVHEKTIKPMRRLLGEGDLGVLTYAWVVPYGILVVLVGLASLRFLGALDRTTRIRLISAAGVFLLGSLGFELIEGAFAHWPSEDPRMLVIYTLEESLEMLGCILAIRALLLHHSQQVAHLTLVFKA